AHGRAARRRVGPGVVGNAGAALRPVPILWFWEWLTMRSSLKRLVAQSRPRPAARRPRPARLRLEALEERLAPDAAGLSAEPNEFRKLMSMGDALLSREELLQIPEFYHPDLTVINAPVGGPLAAPLVADPGAMGPLAITHQEYTFGDSAF